MRDEIVYALKTKYESNLRNAKINIDIMLKNPQAIPEHEDFISAIDKELIKLCDASDKLTALKELF